MFLHQVVLADAESPVLHVVNGHAFKGLFVPMTYLIRRAAGLHTTYTYSTWQTLSSKRLT